MLRRAALGLVAALYGVDALQPVVPRARCAQAQQRLTVVAMSDGGPVERGSSVMQDTEELGDDLFAADLDDWGSAVIDDEEDSGDEDLLDDFDWESLAGDEVKVWPPTPRELCKAEREEHKKTYARHPTDCGSSELQIALFTSRIKHITQHVIDNPKDHASRRGLLALVSKRRRLMNYYYSKAPDKAEKLAADLGIRFRFRAKIPTREEKYLQYTIRANRKRKK